MKHKPVEIEWNREASSLLVLVTLGLFVMTAALLINLFLMLD